MKAAKPLHIVLATNPNPTRARGYPLNINPKPDPKPDSISGPAGSGRVADLYHHYLPLVKWKTIHIQLVEKLLEVGLFASKRWQIFIPVIINISPLATLRMMIMSSMFQSALNMIGATASSPLQTTLHLNGAPTSSPVQSALSMIGAATAFQLLLAPPFDWSAEIWSTLCQTGVPTSSSLLSALHLTGAPKSFLFQSALYLIGASIFSRLQHLLHLTGVSTSHLDCTSPKAPTLLALWSQSSGPKETAQCQSIFEHLR